MLTLLTILALVCFFVPVLGCGWFWPAEAFWTPWAVIGFPLLYTVLVLLFGGLALFAEALPLVLIVSIAVLVCEGMLHGRRHHPHGAAHAA